VADEDRQMSARELETLILRQNRAAMRWDNEVAAVPLQSLNEQKIRRFVETAGLPWDDARNALDKLSLLHDGQPVNAARLFFADDSIELRCAVFATQTSSTIIDRHDFHGDILELIEEAEKYILKNIHIGMKLDGLRRVDVPEIARAALREAIINAFCHRDWRDPDYIHIAIYKDRVEIRNPGGLYDDLTLDDLRRGNVSRRRNPLIADLLRRIHLVEAWGRGMSLILESAPNVTFSEVAGLFIASFQRPTALDTPLKTPETTLEIPEATLKSAETTLETTRETHSQDAKAALLRLLRQQPQLATPALARATGLSADGIKYHLAQLKRAGKLRRHGPIKGGRWEVID
jgi:ATP-dependent DNA helicase RecG